mgnify:CR=1 FL=1
MRLVQFLKNLVSARPSGDTGEQNELTTALVSKVYTAHGMASITVPDDALLQEIIGRLAHDPSLRAVFLVDPEGHLTGTVSPVRLLRWAHFQLFRGKEGHMTPVAEFFRIIDAEKAKDIAHVGAAVLSVREDDPLHVALDKMIGKREDVLPVLNSQGQIMGDLRLSEVLWYVTKTRRSNSEADNMRQEPD